MDNFVRLVGNDLPTFRDSGLPHEWEEIKPRTANYVSTTLWRVGVHNVQRHFKFTECTVDP